MTEPREDSPHTIDAIVAALQSPARAEELEGEEALVGAMAAAVVAIDHEEPASMTFLPRPLKLGLIAGVAVLSVAGVAAAATGALPERRPDRPVATTVVETTSTSPEVDGSRRDGCRPDDGRPDDGPLSVDQPDGGRDDDPGWNTGRRGSGPGSGSATRQCAPVSG